MIDVVVYYCVGFEDVVFVDKDLVGLWDDLVGVVRFRNDVEVGWFGWFGCWVVVDCYVVGCFYELEVVLVNVEGV